MTRYGIHLLALALALALVACGDDDSGGAAPEVIEEIKGASGHSCQTDNDCSEGLACIEQICDLVDFGLTNTTNECKLVSCTQAADCCADPNPACEAWKQACDLGESASCLSYETASNACVCNLALLECADYQCITHECQTSLDCCGAEPPECAQLESNCNLGDVTSCELLSDPATGCCDPMAWTCTSGKSCSPACQDDLGCIGYGVCSFGVCVLCRDEGDCDTGETCADGECVSSCITNADCAPFHQCAAGECVETGCITDAECVALLKDVRGVCTDTRCVLPCQTDADCDDPSNFNFQICEFGLCAIIGCETDQECRLRYGVGPGSLYDAICVLKGL
jgi:hypothetical protein